tara:strand:- start:5221 stop:5538 length:318 start_codon:yes stop_codon:yes gene_type:complete
MAKKGSWEGQNKKTWESITSVVWNLWEFFIDVFKNTRKSDYKNVYEKLDDEKKKKVVKLICMVKGQKIEEEKVVDDFEISVDDIELVLERAKKLRPRLFVENINE